MKLVHGTREEHLGTWERAKANKVTESWTGDVRRNPYLRESLDFGINEGIIKNLEIKDYPEAQQSNFVWEYVESEKVTEG